MGRASQRKGREAERELVSILRSYGHEAEPGAPMNYGTEADVHGLPSLHNEVLQGDITMAEMDITTVVYNSLLESTVKAADKISALEALKADASSGRYTPEVVTSEYAPRIKETERDVKRMSEEARASALQAVHEYANRVRAEDVLEPAELTDDLRLLQPGIKLSSMDIAAMLSRAEGNRTMTQIILRHADDNGIDTGGLHYTGYDVRPDGRELVEALEEAVKVYTDRYMADKDARRMLDCLFQRGGHTRMIKENLTVKGC